jgi:hypothetical protein
MLGDQAYDSAELRDLSVAKPFLIPLTRQEPRRANGRGTESVAPVRCQPRTCSSVRQQLLLGDPGGVRRSIYRSKTISAELSVEIFSVAPH